MMPMGPSYPSSQPLVPDPNNPGTYVPGGTTNGSTPITTPGTNPTYDPNSPSSPNAPPFDPYKPGGSNKNVPDPGNDDGTFNRKTGGTTDNSPLSPTSPTSSARKRASQDLTTPFNQNESRRAPRPQPNEEEAIVEADDFQAPVRTASGVDDGEVEFATSTSTTSKRGVYAHDPEYQWVQGVISYDKPTRTWSIIYDDNPGPDDPLGGDVTLADESSLGALRTGDTVRVYGELDEKAQDSRGKPLYNVTKFTRR
jgi:hypothetical protein